MEETIFRIMFLIDHHGNIQSEKLVIVAKGLLWLTTKQ